MELKFIMSCWGWGAGCSDLALVLGITNSPPFRSPNGGVVCSSNFPQKQTSLFLQRRCSRPADADRCSSRSALNNCMFPAPQLINSLLGILSKPDFFPHISWNSLTRFWSSAQFHCPDLSLSLSCSYPLASSLRVPPPQGRRQGLGYNVTDPHLLSTPARHVHLNIGLENLSLIDCAAPALPAMGSGVGYCWGPGELSPIRPEIPVLADLHGLNALLREPFLLQVTLDAASGKPLNLWKPSCSGGVVTRKLLQAVCLSLL